MRLKAFISSNLNEFGPANNPTSIRRRTAQVLTEFDMEPVMWEDFAVPSDMTDERFYKRYLQDCQIYIGLFGLDSSTPTELEYHESKILHLERWIFVSDSLGADRDPQMQALIKLAKTESVYVKFNSEATLCQHLRARVRTFLPEKVAEYIELTKTRAQEFLIDYRKLFLEPLLSQMLMIQRKIQSNLDLVPADYFSLDNLRVNPYFLVDNELRIALDAFIVAIAKCHQLISAAIRAHNRNCVGATEWLLRDEIADLDTTSRRSLLTTIEQRLAQMNLKNLSDLQLLGTQEREEKLRAISEDLRSAGVLPIGEVSRRIEMLPEGVFERDRKDNDVRSYLEARKTVETNYNRVYEILWKKFLISIGS